MGGAGDDSPSLTAVMDQASTAASAGAQGMANAGGAAPVGAQAGEGADSGQPSQLKYVSRVGKGLHSLLQIPELQNRNASVGSLCVHGNNIASLEGLEQLPSLTDLNLSSNLITSCQPLQLLRQLRKLNLASNQLHSLQGLGALVYLEVLYVAHNHINDTAGLQPENYGLQKLRFVDLRHNRIENAQDLKSLRYCSALTELRLSGNPISMHQEHRLALAEALTGLQSLDEQPLTGERRPTLLFPTAQLSPLYGNPPTWQVAQPQQPMSGFGSWAPIQFAPHPAILPVDAPWPHNAPSAISSHPSPANALPGRQGPGHSDHSATGGAPRQAGTAEDTLRNSSEHGTAPQGQLRHEPSRANSKPASGTKFQENLPTREHGAVPIKPTPRIDTALAGFQRRRSGAQESIRPLAVHKPSNVAGGTATSTGQEEFQSGAQLEEGSRRFLHPNMKFASSREAKEIRDAACQTVQVGATIDMLEAEARDLHIKLQDLSSQLLRKEEEEADDARQFEAEAAAKLFEMQREIDRLQAESDEMQSEIEDLVERLAASESREAGISSRVDELEGELSKSAQQVLNREQIISGLRDQVQEEIAQRNASVGELEKRLLVSAENERHINQKITDLQHTVESLTQARDAAISLSAKVSDERARAQDELRSMQRILEERTASLHAALRTETELRSEVMQLSGALAAAHKAHQENLQASQQAHEEQIRAAVARESDSAEQRGRKLAAHDAMLQRDELQKRLSDTEAEFRCFLRDHKSEVAALKEASIKSAREVAQLLSKIEAMKKRDLEQEKMIAELTEVVSTQKTKLTRMSANSSEAAERMEQQFRSQLEYLKNEVHLLRNAHHDADEMRSKMDAHCEAVRQAEAKAAQLEADLADERRRAEEAVRGLRQRAEAAELRAESAAAEASDAWDAVKVKEKMVDSANATVDELKDAIADLKEQLQASYQQLQDAENDWNEREAEANERQAQLRAEIDAQEASVEEALVAAEAAKAKARAAEKKLRDQITMLDQKEEMLRYVGEEVERCQKMFQEKEARLQAARDVAIKEAESAAQARNEAERRFESLQLQEASLKANVAREKARADQAAASRDKLAMDLQQAQEQVAKVENEMRDLLRANQAQKAEGNRKIAALAKILQELQDPR